MTYKIPTILPPENGRRIAIGDIHGCLKTYQQLIKTIDLQPTDQLFLLGDLIDKGLDSQGVIDYTMQLIKDGYQVFPIKGNHEQSFLMAYQCGIDFFEEYLEKNNADDFFSDKLYEYLDFFDNLEYCYDLGDFMVSHTEFLIHEKSLYRGMNGLFPRVVFDFETEILEKKTQIVGHAVKTLDFIEKNVKERQKILYLDNGCVHKDNEGLGHLVALNLNNWELIVQKNIDSNH